MPKYSLRELELDKYYYRGGFCKIKAFILDNDDDYTNQFVPMTEITGLKAS
jgi:hypothetical protein